MRKPKVNNAPSKPRSVELDTLVRVRGGWVMSAEGGGATSDVITEKVGPS
jgi:hypothetical protein